MLCSNTTAVVYYCSTNTTSDEIQSGLVVAGVHCIQPISMCNTCIVYITYIYI